MPIQSIAGAKGGGSQHTPVESRDSLRSLATFRLLDLISEGEIGGLVNGLQSVYLNETPVANADGSLNFQNVHVEERTGTMDQAVIAGYTETDNEIAVGVELKSGAPWVRSITNTELSGLRITVGFPQLSKADTSTGDIGGYSISYKIEVSTDGGAYAVAYNAKVTGKTTTKYQRSTRVDLPPASSGWNVRVTRLTANANSASVADTMLIDSYTEIIDGKLRYPNSALVAISGDATQFNNIPSRAYDMWLRIVQVPSNYNPLTRAYTGTWDGTFKPAWTDNPAWVYYDLATHTRYGLGGLMTALPSKWDLYRIAQYCDALVPNGRGAMEPRFTFNHLFNASDSAYKVLQDLASVFRGITFWSGSALTVSADMPTDPVGVYSPANVIGGVFTYQSTPKKTRYTTALVTWRDPADFYRAKTHYVQHDAGLARYGVIPTTLTALGATSESQAHRAGMWALESAQAETQSVTFSVGLDGVLAAPGQIIRVADPRRAGKRQGGRIHSATATKVTVDMAPELLAAGDTLTVMLPSGVSETRTVTAYSGAALTVSPAFSEVPAAEAMWTVERVSLNAQLFRVVGVKEEKSETSLTYVITAIQHVAGKYDAIELGAILQIPPISALPPHSLPPPAAVSVTSYARKGSTRAIPVLAISWPRVAGAMRYLVQYRRDSDEWSVVSTVIGNRLEVPNVLPGRYVAQVAAANNLAQSITTVSDAYDLDDSALTPSIVDDIQAQAAAADAAASAAMAEITSFSQDGVLVPTEKKRLIVDFNVLTTEQPGIDAQATAFGVTTAKTAYDAAMTALTTYLGSLDTPTAWNDISGNTTVARTTFNSRWQSVYTTRQTLLNAIYAAAKAKADAAQTAADAAADKAAKVAKGPGVINPRFADGLDGWTFDDSAGFSAGDNANTPWYLVPTHLARAGQAGTPNTNARNTGYIGVVPGQMVTAIVCLRSISANAGALAFASIAWRDFSGTLLSASDSPLTCGPNGTAQNLNSRIAAQAPANAAMAQLIIRYSNHTSGTFTASVCSMVAQPASADEVPESGTRKWAGESGATVGANWYTNVSDKPESADNLVSRSTFDDGNASPWTGGTVALSGHPTAARGYRLNGTEIGQERFTVTPGQVLYCAVDHQDAFLPASSSFSMALRFVNSAGSTIQYGRAFTDASSANSTWHLDRAGLVTVPAGAVKAQVVFYLDNPVTPGTDRVYLTGIRVFKALDSIPDGVGYAKIVSDQLVNGVHKLGIAGSGMRLGDLRNQVMVGVGNFASGWSGGSISYSASTTSATISVAAATLVLGSRSLAYSASSVTVSGSAGSSATYHLYYDDPGFGGGARSLSATTSQITALANDGRVYIGAIKVTFPTSGTGTGSGGTGCPQVDEPVIRRRADGAAETIPAGAVQVGDQLLLSDDRWGRVTYSQRTRQPGVRVEGVDGSSIVCSRSAPLETVDGRCLPAPEVAGQMLRHRSRGGMRAVSVIDLGDIWVQHITCENACFWVGEYAHHNLKPPVGP